MSADASPDEPRLLDAAEPLLRLSKVSKFFGALRALSEVDFDIYPGEIQALVGDNGAGKSTLVKTISGAHQSDEGEFDFKGKPIRITGPPTHSLSALRPCTKTWRWLELAMSRAICSADASRRIGECRPPQNGRRGSRRDRPSQR